MLASVLCVRIRILFSKAIETPSPPTIKYPTLFLFQKSNFHKIISNFLFSFHSVFVLFWFCNQIIFIYKIVRFSLIISTLFCFNFISFSFYSQKNKLPKDTSFTYLLIFSNTYTYVNLYKQEKRHHNTYEHSLLSRKVYIFTYFGKI